MANPTKIRGTDRPIEAPYSTSSTVSFTPGELCYLDGSNDATPMGAVAVTTSFLGVFAQKKPAAATTRIYGNSEDGIIRVDCDGEYEFDCDDTVTLVVGDVMGPDGSGTKIKKVGDETISVGRITKEVTPGTGGRARIKINSAKVPAAKTT